MKYIKTPSFRGYSFALKAWSTCFVVLFGSASLAAPTQWMVADGGNDHFYDVSEFEGTWDEARADAETRFHQGRRGYLVTITSAAEQAFIDAIAPGVWGWIGASDSGAEGEWFWVTGPEAGTQFWTGGLGGTTTSPFNYANWSLLNPNNSGAGAIENCVFHNDVTPASSVAGWNDVPCDNSEIYFIEYSEILVDIDIKPGSDPNCFNVNGHGVIPVAILGSSTFDVTLVDTSSLLFGGLGVRVRGNKGPLCNFEDSDGDTILDVVCSFEDDSTSWAPGDGDATLIGRLLDSTEFEGTDSICVLP